MNFDLQYVNDSNGNVQAVQLPIAEWKKILTELNKFDHASKLKRDLKEAFKEVSILEKSKVKQPTLIDFLNEL